jgi:hypothetical protein
MREEILQIRLSVVERRKAEQVAEKLGSSLSAAYRQAMNRLYDDLFPNRPPKPDAPR